MLLYHEIALVFAFLMISREFPGIQNAASRIADQWNEPHDVAQAMDRK
jgi:hypothetical protein